MTEVDWLTCDEPQALIEFISQGTSERKCRLLAAAMCRHVLPLVIPECAHRAVDTVEAYADSHATVDDLRVACSQASDAYLAFPNPAPVNTEAPLAFKAASIALQSTMFASSEFKDYLVSCCIGTEKACVRGWLLNARPGEERPLYTVLMHWQLMLVRDIFGNPFRPTVFSPAWRTESVVALASAIYDERAFDRMPILADALQDAYCDNEDIIKHCRAPGPHVRGCWVIDLVLGKE